MPGKERMKPTAHLRFVRRVSDNYPDERGGRYILQQLWTTETGTKRQWRYVQRVEQAEQGSDGDSGE